MVSASLLTDHFSPTPHSMASSSSSWKHCSASSENTSAKPSLAQPHVNCHTRNNTDLVPLHLWWRAYFHFLQEICPLLFMLPTASANHASSLDLLSGRNDNLPNFLNACNAQVGTEGCSKKKGDLACSLQCRTRQNLLKSLSMTAFTNTALRTRISLPDWYSAPIHQCHEQLTSELG